MTKRDLSENIALCWISLSLAVILMLVGRDMSSSSFEEEDRRSEEDARNAELERENLAPAMKTVVDERKKAIRDKISERDAQLQVLRIDLDSLIKAIATAMDKRLSSGTEPKHETKVLNVLKDETVNALAVKHLGSDFSILREKFIADVKIGRTEEARYRKAIADADANCSESLAKSKEWDSKNRAQQEAEIARLRSEISRLEVSRSKVRKEMSSLSRYGLETRQRRTRAF